ncbi:MAG: hypothetical protein J0H12_07675 [Candidatus Paracaedimonas acanthamoebae]|uniref:NB-ARC domain-containing protein n=1 Tax=Candidatus Paracaedimonas acanthamoebae TaxID=244581 RepID=A0A8J7PL05_9PROT|nr:hypothetical protein [Candidatus Paracaedimonas acanthamoebae]
MQLTLFILLIFISLTSQASYGAEFTYHIPTGNTFFQGRKEELSKVSSIFKSENIVALVGLPGIGKSALAQEFSWKNKDKYNVILKLECTGDIRAQLINFGRSWNQRCATPLEKIPENYLTLDTSLQILKSWIPESSKKNLIILEDGDKSQEIKSILTTFKDKKDKFILMTSRSLNVECRKVHIEKLNRQDSIGLLEKFIEWPKDKLDKISSLLGDYPLALTQAGVLIRALPSMTPDEYQKLFEKKRSYLESLHQKVNKDTDEESINYKETVFATLALTFEDLKKKNLNAYKALTFLAFLHPNHIKEDTIKECAGLLGINKDLLHELIYDLVNSLYLTVDTTRENNAVSIYKMHPLIQVALKESLPEGTKSEIQALWVKYFRSHFSGGPHELEKFVSDRSDYYEHMKTLIEDIDADHANIQNSLELKIDLARVAVFSLADFEFGDRWAYEAEEAIKKGKNVNNFAKGRLHNTLGNITLLTDVNKAIDLTLKGIALLEKEPHKISKAEQLFALINNLPDYYSIQGNITHALEALKKAEPILRDVNNPSYYCIFFSVYANMLMFQGQNEKALSLINKSLKSIQEGRLPEPPYLFVKISKAEILARLGNFEESLKLATICYDELMKICNSDCDYKAVRLKITMATNYLFKNDLAKGLKCVTQAIEHCNKLVNGSDKIFLQGWAHLVLGEIYERKKDLSKAWREYRIAERIYDKINPNCV